jgi:hypothetical protein
MRYRLNYRGTVAARFASRIRALPNGCWLWTGFIDPKGYAHFTPHKKPVRAHVWGWARINGPVPVGFELDHNCRNRACVRPSHCEPVTHAENMRRGKWATATHCVNGHLFSVENTHIRPSNGQRVCRKCDVERRKKSL